MVPEDCCCCALLDVIGWNTASQSYANTAPPTSLLLLQICFTAYDIRLYAIKDYGAVIHEFDPWFNFRATQYLADNGWEAFTKWFDHMSWLVGVTSS